jgi:hypothetical protein
MLFLVMAILAYVKGVFHFGGVAPKLKHALCQNPLARSGVLAYNIQYQSPKRFTIPRLIEVLPLPLFMVY